MFLGPLSVTETLLIAFLSGMNITTEFDFPKNEIYLSELDHSFTKNLGLKPEVKFLFQLLVQHFITNAYNDIKIFSTFFILGLQRTIWAL